jgi:2,4-dienoyl-CoA reductase-like NADH-dependent reductase (Old Yellow Enzyme family)
MASTRATGTRASGFARVAVSDAASDEAEDIGSVTETTDSVRQDEQPAAPAGAGPVAITMQRKAPGVVPDVFAPAQLGPITLRNRVIKSATFEGRTPKALVTDELIEYHVAPSSGGVGMTTVAYLAVAPEGRTDRHQIYWREEALPGLRRLTDAVHATGAAVSAQLGHAGPVANSASNRLPALAPTRRFSPFGSMNRGASTADIDRIVKAHADAARLAGEVGFDAVELHFGHNYLASSFLSAKLNRRSDGYGGSLAGRARFAREIAAAVRAEVGGRLAILAKLNMDDGVPGGLWLDESVQVAKWLEEDGTLDALELTCGSSLLNPMYLFRGEAPVREFANAFKGITKAGLKVVGPRFLKAYPYQPLYMLDYARQFRAALTMPLVLLGGVTDRAGMDTAMAEGFQFVAMARALLREPDLLNRLQREENTKSLCVHCNRCMPTIYSRSRCVLIDPNP